MKAFMSEDFLLQTETAKRLYHDFAENMPIFDYHCHLPVAEIAANKTFENLTDIWLGGDHYKWRAMRANGVPERLITGDADDFEKFQAWAATVPKTLRNPLYHWTHLELKRTFGVSEKLLNPETAEAIYTKCSAMLRTSDFSTRRILERMNVRVVCTTDDPTDNLEHHLALKAESGFTAKILPAFRPDKALGVDSPSDFNRWIERLESSAGIEVKNFDSFIEAIRQRHDFFHATGCRLSDHGIEQPFAADYTAKDVSNAFETARQGKKPTPADALKFKSAVTFELARMDAEKDWTQQFHFGALRNINSRAMATLGADTGYDTIGDWEIARALARFLDRLDREGRLAKTILYVMNSRDNEAVAAAVGCFQDGSLPGKMQFGSAWWFNDQKDGIEKQINALSNLGLLSRFVGMLTDSRSFLSYPRHEYFRRVLCNLLGNDVENGELPGDMELLGGMVKDICFRNAVAYFGIDAR
ncbi:MAG: glucuronate isomerase [Desulfobacterales bacterium]|jgi:glucuronate isomerase|nr:glucuronate isomerase [Desulfobacterales bacterium]